MNDFFIHETSFIDDNCEIGEGTKIWHFSHVLPRSKIGERCNIGQNVVIGPEVSIAVQEVCEMPVRSVHRGLFARLRAPDGCGEIAALLDGERNPAVACW